MIEVNVKVESLQFWSLKAKTPDFLMLRLVTLSTFTLQHRKFDLIQPNFLFPYLMFSIIWL